MDYFDPDAVQEDEEDAEEDNGWRDNVLVLVDAQPSMLEPLSGGLREGREFPGCKSWLEAAIKVCAAIIRTKIIEGAVDYVGVAFYNTEKSFNALGVSAVYVEQDMFDHPPNAERAVQIEQLTQENFLERIGMGRSDEESRSLGLDSALWVASSLLPGSANVTNKYIKQHRVLLLTRDDCPASDSAIVQQRARNISVKGATLQLAPLAGPDDEFDYTRFWESVLLAAPPSTPFYVATPSDRQDEGITDLAKSVDNDVREQILSMPALASVVRMRAYRKRSTSRMSWALGPGGPVIGIRLYALVQPAWPAMRGPPSWLHAADYCKLELDRQPIDTTTGIPLDKSSGMHQPRLYYPKTADRWAAKHNETEQNKNHPGRRRFPKVYFEPDEVAALKWPVTKGMSLLAFKPMTTLLPWHQLRPPSFCFPDEHAMPGSFRAFSCLHAAMLERHLYAVCAFVRSPSSEPRLVAAVPQSEERDEGGAQVTPPGFHLIHLPYSDDVRYPESDITFTGPLQSKSFDDESEQATDKLLDRLEQISDSVPDLIDIPNPHVQRWFQVLEGVLMREAGVIGTISHLTNQDDPVNTVDNMTFQGIEDVVDGFLETICATKGDRDALTGKPVSSKRSLQAPGEGQWTLVKRGSKEGAQSEGVEGLAREGRLASLTVTQLKEWLGEQGLLKSGRKGDLIDRITEYVESEKDKDKDQKNDEPIKNK